MTVSRRLAEVPESATLAITRRAAELRASGEDVIGFGAGEPDFPTPDHIVAAAQRAAAEPVSHRYSPAAGHPPLREAVAAKTAASSAMAVSAPNVVITNGAKGAVHAACQALLDPGDEVLLIAPYWVSYPHMITLAGGVPRLVGSSIETGFKVTVDDLEAVRTERTRALIFVSPSNPTGAVYGDGELAEIGRWAAAHSLWVITDEIYENLVYGEARFASLPQVAPEAAERCVVINGVAKTFAMTGWRVGWLVAPDEIAAAAARFQSHTASNVSNVSQAAALEALTGPQEGIESMRSEFELRRDLMHGMLSRIPGVRTVAADGAFYELPNIEGALSAGISGTSTGSDIEFAAALLDHAAIAVVPGSPFGAPGHVRLSFALGRDDIERGLDRWMEAVSG